MLNKSNLALVLNESYNYKDNKIHISKVPKDSFLSTSFIIQTKYSMILRENILASGMEISDISKAKLISDYYLRR